MEQISLTFCRNSRRSSLFTQQCGVRADLFGLAKARIDGRTYPPHTTRELSEALVSTDRVEQQVHLQPGHEPRSIFESLFQPLEGFLVTKSGRKRLRCELARRNGARTRI